MLSQLRHPLCAAATVCLASSRSPTTKTTILRIRHKMCLHMKIQTRSSVREIKSWPDSMESTMAVRAITCESGVVRAWIHRRRHRTNTRTKEEQDERHRYRERADRKSSECMTDIVFDSEPNGVSYSCFPDRVMHQPPQPIQLCPSLACCYTSSILCQIDHVHVYTNAAEP